MKKPLEQNMFPKDLMNKWAQKDPISNYENFLVESNVLSIEEMNAIKSEIKIEINDSWLSAENEESTISVQQNELSDIFKPFSHVSNSPNNNFSKIRLVDAISNSLSQSMETA